MSRLNEIFERETLLLKANPSPQTVRRAADKVGDHLLTFARDIRQSVILLQSQQSATYDPIVRGITMRAEDKTLDESSASVFLQSVNSLLENTDRAVQMIAGLRETLASAPRLTAKIIAGRDAAIEALLELQSTVESGIRTMVALRSYLMRGHDQSS